jgi:hypothetical protein
MVSRLKRHNFKPVRGALDAVESARPDNGSVPDEPFPAEFEGLRNAGPPEE